MQSPGRYLRKAQLTTSMGTLSRTLGLCFLQPRGFR